MICGQTLPVRIPPTSKGHGSGYATTTDGSLVSPWKTEGQGRNWEDWLELSQLQL